MGDPLQEHEWGIHYRSMSGESIIGVREEDPLLEHEWEWGPLQEQKWRIYYRSEISSQE